MRERLSAFKQRISGMRMRASENFYDFCQRIFYDKPVEYLLKLLRALFSPFAFLLTPQESFKTRAHAFSNHMLEDQEFANRVFSSLLMTAVSLPVILIGGWLLQILVLAAAAIAAWEWAGLNPGGVFSQKRNLLVGFTALSLLVMKPLGPAAPALIAVFMLLDNFVPRLGDEKTFHNQIGFAYLFVAALSFTWLHDYFGALAALWLVLTVIATDVAAYLGGKAFGKRKLMPEISPGKTVAGAVCGLLAAGVVGWLYSLLAGTPMIFFLLLSLLTSAAAQGGDLLESLLKRRANVKNSGNIIPGHGGMLDRIDGFLMASPTAFLVLQITDLVS